MRKWIEQKPGIYTLDTGLFTIHAGWISEDRGYGYAYMKVKSKQPFWTIDECKWAAVASARKRIQAAWDKLK